MGSRALPMLSKKNIGLRLSDAVKAYWTTRDSQQLAQGADGLKDTGLRSAVTGGKHLDGMCQVIAAILSSAGLKDLEVFSGRGKGVLPGYYRPTKDWDVVAVADDKDGRRCLIAAVEVKSHAGPSFGNNFNNRVEETLGNSTDFWAAYEKSILPAYPAPFLGYIMLLEEMRQSTSAAKTLQPYFAVDAMLRDASYRDRYQVLCDRLMRERRYSGSSSFRVEIGSFVTTW